ncbi:hypothetical protein HO173_000107 [Letharia columbiana]|uniref:Uncharacterized protein n=1 Tax=Letharia columbiana TaxID=112416 RepID=A0A8H6G6C9_9LECA|nr:uncharacterized protein HO173_000107 [Letharia columbiana]KAF6241397.1 hypothetical protein HO173_000107 [Letharia columbiana]
MCQGIQQIYAECGHEHNIEVTEPCTRFSNHPSLKLCTFQTIYTKAISEPVRCTPCSRRVERNIIKEYEIQNAQYETQVQLLTRELRAEMDADRRREMRGKISDLVEELGDSKDRRNEEIAEVRFRHGGRASC